MLKRLIDYLVNDLGIDKSAASSIIFTLLTFSLGFIITWLAKEVSKWKKKKTYKKSLKIIIRDFLNSCQRQYLALENFSTQKGYLYGCDYTIPIASNFSQNYLTNLNISIFLENFSSILKKKRANEISQIFEIIENVRSSKESLKETMNFTYSKYSEFFDIYNSNLDNLRKLQDDLALEYNGKIVDTQLGAYIHSICQTFINWKETGAITYIDTTLNEIVNPLYDKALSFPPNPISRNIIDYCLKCRLSVENIINIENLIKNQINDSKTIHKNSYDKGILIINKW